ncbi:hypothetical protein ZHAS_00020138 [Anopheles sinensis]|uniref:Uncharacterized protein n=1 Tax=Anopheles sinensis TaxID=74873 RepID=A0A084WP25_ANOSI|nr:hypothetical protein ZHAS_00020138 [Anopheles sinensis]
MRWRKQDDCLVPHQHTGSRAGAGRLLLFSLAMPGKSPKQWRARHPNETHTSSDRPPDEGRTL